MRRVWILAAMVGCTGATTSLPSSSGTDRPVTDSTSTTPPETTEPEVLRPPVQQGPPNAEGQVPAFEGQTRAPQPAVATAFATETIASGLQSPWALEFLPDGRVLVTERPGRLRIITPAGVVGEPLGGLPAIYTSNQGGLLDVALSPDFEETSRIFWSFAEARDGGTNGTSVATGVISADETTVENAEVIFRQQPAWNSSLHFGSRLVFAPDGNLFVTLGERSVPDARVFAQDPATHLGAIVRIRPDGTVPDDNPYLDQEGAMPELWSKGHRNLQSATLDLKGRLWTVEHGPRGGDELNRPEAGLNYGWPIITYGEDYSGAPIGDGITAQEGLEQPVYYWDPVIAPCGMSVYSGTLFEGWTGDFLVGGLQALAVVRLSMRDDRVYTEEWLEIGARVRDVKVAPDGAVWILTEETSGRVIRLTPETAG